MPIGQSRLFNFFGRLGSSQLSAAWPACSATRRAVLSPRERRRRAPLLGSAYPDNPSQRSRGACGVPRPSPAERVSPVVPGNSRACVAWHCAGPLHLRENAAAPVSCAGRLEILPLDIMRVCVHRVLCFCARQGCSSAKRPSWHIWRPPSERAPGGAGGASEQQKVCACMRARDVSPVTEGEERVLWLLSAPERPCGCGWGHFSDSRPRCACNWVASVPNT